MNFELSQNTRQRGETIYMFLLDIYRITVGTLLILSIPQRCETHACTMEEKWRDHYDKTIVCNFLTLIAFVVLCGSEMNREYTLIKYLEVNPKRASDGESVSKVLKEKLKDKAIVEIGRSDRIYRRAFVVTSALFVSNSVASAFVVFHRMDDMNTIIAFATNIILTGLKLAEVFTITRVGSSVYYSAYMVEKVQYNDVDPKAYVEDILSSNIHLKFNKKVTNRLASTELPTLRQSDPSGNDPPVC